LRQELGVEPDAETRALADRVRRERVPPPVSAADGALATTPRGRLVGRGAQLRSMVDVWTAALSGRRAAVVVVEGDAGTGKTRLAEELAARARLDGAGVAAVRAVEGDGGDAWSGVFGIARGGLLDAPGAAAAPPPLLAQLRGTAPPESLGRALSEVLHAVADEQPVLVFLDDAQWLDRDTLLALGVAARDLARSPVVFVITAGRAPTRPELDELRTRVGRELVGTVIKLTPLGRDEVREIARLSLPRYTPEELDRLTRRVLADSAGIALLVVALLNAVASGLSLDETVGAWPERDRTLNDTLPGELPDNVVAAIRINYRRLSADAQLVLVAAAVLGGRVSAATLGRASRLTGTALARALDELEWQSWLTAERRGYAFVARIVRDVIDRDMVMEGERQRIRDAARETS
ncbi:MAG TPA: AAA family ATPase, partial [Gemmatimonadales bacterium]|nr:AAA family ATPase [Gemmatimonadales bacterium]